MEANIIVTYIPSIIGMFLYMVLYIENLSKKGFIYQLSNSLIICCIFMILSVLQILTILMNHTIDTDIKILE